MTDCADRLGRFQAPSRHVRRRIIGANALGITERMRPAAQGAKFQAVVNCMFSLPPKKGVAVTFWSAVIVILFAIVPSGSVRASDSAGASAWRGFFKRVLPAARLNFAPLRGTFDAKAGNYAVKVPLNPAIVMNCIIFETGALDSHAWDLRCDLSGNGRQAAGPSTQPGALMKNVAAALPGFHRRKNLIGEPEWVDAHHTSVTIVFGGILIKHGYNGI